MAQAIAAARSGLVKASVADTLPVLGEVVLPTLAKGIIIRRPKVVAVAERLELDRRAVRRLQKPRAKYGDGPVLLAIPGRSEAVLLSPDHLRRVLEGTPRPFSPASAEKRAALGHFEPNVSLISRGPERTERRAFNEAVLDSGCPVHSLADKFLEIVDEEAQELLGQSGDELDWDGFAAAWHRLVRRVVLGNAARDDHELTEMLAKLRGAANWAFLHPGRKALLRRFHERLPAHLARAERGSLAQRIGELPRTEATAPSDQVAHYLFAFDAGGIATYRALALLASHSRQGQRAREEIAAGGSRGKDLAFLRACVLDGLRLWPTTPAILRETTEDVPWDGALLPKNTNILVFTPFFHRDGENVPYADRFTPELWLGEPQDRARRWCRSATGRRFARPRSRDDAGERNARGTPGPARDLHAASDEARPRPGRCQRRWITSRCFSAWRQLEPCYPARPKQSLESGRVAMRGASSNVRGVRQYGPAFRQVRASERQDNRPRCF